MKPEIEAQFRAEARTAYLESLALLTLPEASNPALFALKYRRIGQGASPLSMHGDIPYVFDRFPFLREPHEAATDPEVQILALEFASSMGKSEVAANVIGHVVVEAPCNIIVAYPKEDSIAKFSRDVVQRSLIDPTPAVRTLISEKKSRDGANTINYKQFAGGSIYMVGANSAANFRGPRCGMAYGGEIDGMEKTSEGDPIALLLKRCEGFENSIKILEGTPTVSANHPSGKGRIEKWMAESDRRKWFVPCRKCGKMQVLMWKQIVWPKDGKNRHEKAELLCEHCAASHNDRQRLEMVLQGVWRPTQEFVGIRGYWLNGINTTLPAEKGFKGNKMFQFARDAHNAAKSKDSKRVWENTFLAEPSADEEADDKQDWRKLYDRREAYPVDGRVPQGVIILESGTDVQSDRIEAEIQGFGKDEECWGIENAVFFGDPRLIDVWMRLDAWLNRVHIREDGARLTVRGGGFDTGFPNALRMEYEWIRPRQHRNYHALKGASLIDAPLVTRSKASKVDRVSLKLVGTHRIKDLLYDRALLETPGPGYLHFPATVDSEGKPIGVVNGYDEEWFKQFLSETPYPIYKAGVRLRQFKHEKINETLERNEKLDIRVYGLAALYLRGPINWEAEERANLATVPATGEQKVAIAPKGFRQGGGFRAGGGSWRR